MGLCVKFVVVLALVYHVNCSCITIGGADIGALCIFPFYFDNTVYRDCTLNRSDDGKLWCSTLTDSNGNHVQNQGNWGHCPSQPCGAQANIESQESAIDEMPGKFL